MLPLKSIIVVIVVFVIFIPVLWADRHDCDCSQCISTVPDCSGSAGTSEECSNCCANGNCGGYTWTQTSPCFHEDSIINYKGQDYTLQDFLANKESECRVPHVPVANGVMITTSCGKTIRLTDNHLLATQTGYQVAVSLKVGEVLFGNMEGTEECIVQSVEKEKTTQNYFGLNCLSSEVLVNGIKASTFGDFHTVPSWYMYYAGNVLGVDRASKFGDFLANWYFSSRFKIKQLQSVMMSWIA